ncbi:hypothetical protein BDV38DRAFT_272357 [Aspergillus pseudotamarii]|uniref:RelA/SpoT domain-containing protein n=1 Tax=Aspergillus pseudotamarii TaxID=132259 RepID=A0A5N6SRR9_ASPPS|nr:uncharacterized protein BDV38DRAFT_272357 [Aspergillus pseudotamarii]KAE8136083.1 hypothetical protein BDV38DRAFT_272357 [Aspergillus pseudotamarii]
MPSEADKSIKIINEFMREYKKDKEIYALAAQRAEELCTEVLKRESVECIVTSRAKDPESLERKLHERLSKRQEAAASSCKEKKGYGSIDDIRSDIADLVGVRISLYLPRKKSHVEKILRREFEVPWNLSLGEKENAQATQPRLFPGYCADHYRVFFKDDSIQDKRLDKRMIEIQVVSVLRHVWAQIQHDRVYKQLIPTTGEDIRILDALSSLLYAGDFVLDQLFDSQTSRSKSDGTPFKSVYQLGSSLGQWIENFPERRDDNLGDVQSLFTLLRALRVNTPKELWGALRNMDISLTPTSDYMALARKYEPLHLSISNYVMHRIIWPRDDQCIVQSIRRLEPNTLNNNWYKVNVIANAFILLDQLFSPPSEWLPLLYTGQDAKRHEGGIKWMSTGKPWTVCHRTIPLHKADQKNIDVLWHCFNQHHKEPIRFVFTFSQILVVEGFSTDRTLLDKSLSLLIRAIEISAIFSTGS